MILLIVSQYRYSRHLFLVEYVEETFRDSARGFIKELEEYKRPEEWAMKEIHYGDLIGKHFSPDKSRYNVNDAGDIYFLIKEKVSSHMREIEGYIETSIRESVGYKSKIAKMARESIETHHDYGRVREIVEKYFKTI